MSSCPADLAPLYGRTVVVKIGGHAMTAEAHLRAFAADVTALRAAGVRPVVVHGGGPQISAHLQRLGQEPAFRSGLRVTTPETMDVVRMVLAGQVQRNLVGLLNRHAPVAVGMTGEDARTLTAVRRYALDGGRRVDIGLVGEVTEVDPALVGDHLAAGRIPVISSIAPGTEGEIYNVNADTAAAALAVALGAERLCVLTDVDGIQQNWPGPGPVLRELTVSQARRLQPDLSGGMAPKVEACLTAVTGGVGSAHILDGRREHALLHSLSTGEPLGTRLVPDGVAQPSEGSSRCSR
ncbi:acetylglutamate kinase [Streptomyces cinnabarinus]|uniref:Acetylglutamate kinase n=1 Tax=Streptomyces cinnabarinus TaxID=67287 RepID=A0ABY7KBD8_9ACTN|nr:acetylglutamate kinase [Streptomyces cinnabarinus]WAZ21826.1 acetylglutamate kinase [Streptomyces cinnabarinus]